MLPLSFGEVYVIFMSLFLCPLALYNYTLNYIKIKIACLYIKMTGFMVVGNGIC
jgi:hypothetical protein